MAVCRVSRVRRGKLTYLDATALFALRDLVRDADRQGRPGALVECGCALGGSAIVMAASRNGDSRPLYVYDVFGMIPPPGQNDGPDVHERYATIAGGQARGLGDDTYYGYKVDLQAEVVRSFTQFGIPPDARNVNLVKGLFQETITLKCPVAVAHVDGDWYESVFTCLDKIWPLIVTGGVMVIDDYFAWSGCRDAVNDFLAGQSDCEPVKRSRLHLLKH